MFTFSARRLASTTYPITHSHHHETPGPVYLVLLMHTKTRKRDLVDILFHLCLSVSYDRVLSISTDLGNKICHDFQKEDAVCLPQLKGGLFTAGAVDNIYHYTSSTSAQDSFNVQGSRCSNIRTLKSVERGMFSSLATLRKLLPTFQNHTPCLSSIVVTGGQRKTWRKY